MDPRLQRRIRLENENIELMRLNGPVIQIEPLGTPPYSSYRVTFHIRTFIGKDPIRYRDVTVCKLTLPDAYPDEPPELMCVSRPVPLHVNWFRSGRWCYGLWSKEEPLASYLLRAARTLNNDPSIVNVGSPANPDAIPFWESIKNNKQLVPCDRTPLPSADAPTIEVRRQSPSPSGATGHVTSPTISGKITVKSPNKPKITIVNKSSGG